MTNAAADWQLCVYANAMHGFTERNVQRPGAQYHEATDRRSWRAMRALFDEAFGRVESSPGAHHQSVQQ